MAGGGRAPSVTSAPLWLPTARIQLLEVTGSRNLSKAQNVVLGNMNEAVTTEMAEGNSDECTGRGAGSEGTGCATSKHHGD